MKKIVFAVQVIGLITMFPVVVVLEMNHATGKLIDRNSPRGVTKKVDIMITRSAGKLKIQNEESNFELSKNIMLLKTTN